MFAILLLGAAIVADVVATVALRETHGFTRLLPTAIVVVGYGLNLWLLALVLRRLDLSLVYAVWSGVGTAMIAAIGIYAFGEQATALKLGSLALIVIGVVGLNLGSAS